MNAALVEADSKLLKVTEFVTVGEIATMMDISSTEIISACMTLGNHGDNEPETGCRNIVNRG